MRHYVVIANRQLTQRVEFIHLGQKVVHFKDVLIKSHRVLVVEV